MDAGDPATLGVFWAGALGLTWRVREGGEGLLTGPTKRHAIWVSRVPEPKTVKNRVHLDVYARDLRTWRRWARPSSSRSPASASGR